MSGVEILGVIAAAAQLIEYSFKIVSSIIRQYTKHQRFLEKLRCHQINFHDLIAVAADIKENAALHTNFIIEKLNTTLEEAKQLFTLLTHECGDPTRLSVGSYWIWVRISGEDAILEGLKRLEKQTAGLQLRISVTQTRISSENTNILKDIHESLAGLSAMSRKDSQGWRSKNTQDPNLPNSTTVGEDSFNYVMNSRAEQTSGNQDRSIALRNPPGKSPMHDQFPSEDRNQKPRTSNGHKYGPITSDAHIRVFGNVESVAGSSKAQATHGYDSIAGRAGHETFGNISQDAYKDGLEKAEKPWKNEANR